MARKDVEEINYILRAIIFSVKSQHLSYILQDSKHSHCIIFSMTSVAEGN